MKNKQLAREIAAVLLVLGGLNWGLIGLFNWNLVGSVFESMPEIARFIYAVVGLAALYRVFEWVRSKK